MQLAGTCALEHFTATLANAILSDPAHLAGAETEAQRMWRWHAIEEIEHKAVAYDTLLLAMRDRPRFRRWTLRSFSMLAAGVRFHYVVFRNTADLLRRRELDRVRRLIEGLPDRCRRIFELRKVEGLPQKEVAERLGVTEHVVENDVTKGLKLILQAIAQGEQSAEQAMARMEQDDRARNSTSDQ